MRRYNKLWVHLAGAAGILLTQHDLVSQAEWQGLVQGAVVALSAFGVWGVANRNASS